MKIIGLGIYGLDKIISVRKGNLITVAGAPGVGKTTFAAQFIHRGLLNNENGVYVSFAESRETFLNNMRSLGLDFERFEKERRFLFLDLLTVRAEGVSAVIEEILRAVDSSKSERLVIDSFTAMAQAFGEKIEARIILHDLLNRIINRMGCTTLIVVETPIGSERLGAGLEEFISDNLIVMKREMWNERIIRKLEIIKTRGNPINRPLYLFTMENGINILFPFTSYKGKLRHFESISDSQIFSSTGDKALDQILGEGIPQGSVILIEEDERVPEQTLNLLWGVSIKNWVSLGKGVIILPNPKMPTRKLKGWMRNNLEIDDEVIANQVRILLRKKESYRYIEDKSVAVFRGIDPKDDLSIQLRVLNELRKKTGKPVMVYLPIDFIHSFYRDKLEEWLNTLVAEIIEGGDLLVIRSFSHSPIIRYLASLSLTHIKLRSFQGNILLCCEKPWTKFYHLSVVVDREGVNYKLAPII